MTKFLINDFWQAGTVYRPKPKKCFKYLYFANEITQNAYSLTASVHYSPTITFCLSVLRIWFKNQGGPLKVSHYQMIKNRIIRY